MLYLLRERSVRVLLDGMHVQQRRTGVCLTGEAHPRVVRRTVAGLSTRNQQQRLIKRFSPHSALRPGRQRKPRMAALGSWRVESWPLWFLKNAAIASGRPKPGNWPSSTFPV
jgi:hypothetical protein